MRQAFLAFLCAACAATPALAAGKTYVLDKDHTEVRFYWDHAGVSEQSGEWAKVDGTVSFDPDDIAATRVSITIDPASVDTGVASIDRFMTGPDMFDTGKFHTITFESTDVERLGDNKARMQGKLTIKGRTQPVELDVTLNYHGPHPIAKFLSEYRGEWLGVHATGKLHRSLFDLGYGYPLVGDTIRLDISSEMKAP